MHVKMMSHPRPCGRHSLDSEVSAELRVGLTTFSGIPWGRDKTVALTMNFTVQAVVKNLITSFCFPNSREIQGITFLSAMVWEFLNRSSIELEILNKPGSIS